MTPSVVAQTTDAGSPSLVAEGKASQTADIFEVLSDYGGTKYFWLDASGNTHIAGTCYGCTPSDMMTTDTAQDVTATKSFKADQGFYDYVKFYAGNNASSFSWMEGAATTTQLAWYDSSSSKRMYLDVNGSAWFLVTPSVVAQTTDAGSPSLVVEGKAGQTADFFQVLSDYQGTKYLWVDNGGFTDIRHVLHVVRPADSASFSYMFSTAEDGSGAEFEYKSTDSTYRRMMMLGVYETANPYIHFMIGSTLYVGITSSDATARCIQWIAGVCVDNTGNYSPGSPVGTIFTVFGAGGNLTAGYTRYTSQVYPVSDTETNAQRPIASAGTFRNLFARTTVQMPAQASLVFMLRKNGADTAITVTIAANAAAGTYSDTTHTVSFAQGDLWDIRIVNSGGGASAYLSAVDIEFN